MCGAATPDRALVFSQVGPGREQLAGMRRDILRSWAVLVAVMGLSVAEEFPWTKNNPGSFYYGTFPAGTFQPRLVWGLQCSTPAPVFAQGSNPKVFLVLPGKWQKQKWRLLQNAGTPLGSGPGNTGIHITLHSTGPLKAGNTEERLTD